MKIEAFIIYRLNFTTLAVFERGQKEKHKLNSREYYDKIKQAAK